MLKYLKEHFTRLSCCLDLYLKLNMEKGLNDAQCELFMMVAMFL